MLITVRVKPGSRKGPLVEPMDASRGEAASGTVVQFTVYVQERAADGRANTAVGELLARHFGVAKSRVELLRGHSGRLKTFRIAGDDSR